MLITIWHYFHHGDGPSAFFFSQFTIYHKAFSFPKNFCHRCGVGLHLQSFMLSLYSLISW